MTPPIQHQHNHCCTGSPALNIAAMGILLFGLGALALGIEALCAILPGRSA